MPDATTTKAYYKPKVSHIQDASQSLKSVVIATPLMANINLSDTYQANILLKREDLQIVRSYKIRGAYNKIKSLGAHELKNGVVCASAGNHAQGVAFSCQKLGIKGTIFMPNPTPSQKIKQVKMFGKEFVEIILTGDTYDDAFKKSQEYCAQNHSTFIHPFDDKKVIEGQATIGLEILNDVQRKIDYLFVPIGGGGLASGLSTLFKELSPETKIIGVEPAGAQAMKVSMEKGEIVELKNIDKFVDGAAVQRVGDLTFPICRDLLDDIITVPEGAVCTTILKLYNEDAIVVEPAGALSITALEYYKDTIKGKNVVCIVSGSNNDITRTEEIKERSMLFEGLKHYFIVRFPQRAGALREFLNEVLGAEDDIAHFQYSKKNSRERGPAVIGIELKNKEDYFTLIKRMDEKQIVYEYLNDNPDLFQFIV
ncbi:MAG: threonine ammonia-lyase [Bacteroidales bacterium]|nr:threonine ammonia-lyase [Bacteroidales bacterium]